MAGDGKIRGAMNDEQFEAFCAELMALPKAERTLHGIAAFFQKRTGVKASHEAARTFVKGPFARYVEKLHAGREAREQLCAAAGAGVHPVDAMEDMVAIELQDHLTNPGDGGIDVKWVIAQLVKLRTSISMRENSRRQQADLERKQSETAAKLALAERREALLQEQIARLEREKADWERKREDAKVALAAVAARQRSGLTAESLRKIEEAAALL